MSVAPTSKAPKPIPLSQFLMIQWLLPPPNSLYHIVIAMTAILAPKTAVENCRETKRQTGTKDQRRMRARRRVILPDGTGRSGLLSVSSETADNEHVWLEVVNWRRWSQSHRNSSAKCLTDQTGAVTAPAIAYRRGISMTLLEKLRSWNNYDWNKGGLDVWFCEEE